MTSSPVVLDNGTGNIRCGYAGVSPLPLVVCPTVVGHPTHNGITSPHALNSRVEASFSSHLSTTQHAHGDVDALARRARLLQQNVLCGNDLAGLRGDCDMIYPVKNGVIHNMEAMQELWNYVLYDQLPRAIQHNAVSGLRGAEMGTTSSRGDIMSGRHLLLTEPPNVALQQRCEMMEVFFEEHHVDFIQSTPQGVLSLFANGAECGVVVECGEGLTHCTPVVDGYVLATAQRRMDLGGRAVTDYLARLLREHQGGRGIVPFQQKDAVVGGGACLADEDVVRRLKERYCYVSVNVARDRQLAHSTNVLQQVCVLPDGAQCRLGAERFTAPEVLFRPHLMDYECSGLTSVLWESIEASDVDVRKALYANVLLSGGSTLLPGFGARLTHELRSLYLSEKAKGDAARMMRCPIEVKEPPRRQCLAFMGGALVAELTADQPEMWMSRQAYEEGGTSAIVARYPTT